MRGPLPDSNARRRNKPTIPTTKLPASGVGLVPVPPSWVELGESGSAWWEWAWTQPQSAGWGVGAGMESLVARRAGLEDDLSALRSVDGLDLWDLGVSDSVTEFKAVVRRVAALATGKLQIVKEMRELEDRLGLSPKGLAALRWSIVEDDAGDVPVDDEVSKRREERRKAALG